MPRPIPAVSGNDLIALLLRDGWEVTGQNSHVKILRKKYPERTRITLVQPINDSLAKGTLSAILGPKQTGIGKNGLRRLLDKHR